jgi:putative transposase
MARKEWFSAQELAGLPGMPGTDRGVRMMFQSVQKNLGASRTKVRGKGLEYAIKILPAETQAHLEAQAFAAVLADLPAELPAPAPVTPKAAPAGQLVVQTQTSRALATPDAVAFDGSTEADRDQARAITVVLRKVAELEAAGAHSVKAACQTLIHSARAGLLPALLVDNLRAARDKRGRPSADGLPSTRALELWVLRAKRGESLVPKKPQPDMTLSLWMVAALELKRRPQKPTTKMVHEQLVANWNPAWGAKPPSYDQVTYFFKHKFSSADLMVGQHMGSALASKRAYQKRSTAGLDPFIEVHADGWNTHFNAPHPVTGEFVTLEVWHFHELVTRYVTRPSIGLSESMAVILAGLENYIREMGVPAVWQTDSTGSVKNKTVKDDPLVSIAARAGISIVHPVKVGNSQANGIAENWNTWIDRESRELATYQHPQRMDPLAFKQVRKFTDKMVKAARTGDMAEREQNKRAAERAGRGLVFDSFAQAHDWINAKVDKFNNSPHSELPRVTDLETGRRRHQTPAEAKAEALAAGFEPVRMDESALIDLFRIHVKRRVQRATVSPYLRQEYRHEELAHYEKQDVMVAIDIMDGSRVWIKDLSGRVICEAPVVEVTGYRSMSFYEMSLEKRMTAQIKRKELQIEAIQERMDPDRMPVEVKSIEMQAAQVLDFGPRIGREALTAAPQSGFEQPGLTLQASAAPQETPDEAQMRWYAEEAERAEREQTQEQDDGEDRLFLMMRAEQDERERREQEESDRRKAM